MISHPCRGCQAPILLVSMVRGGLVPVDDVAASTGRLACRVETLKARGYTRQLFRDGRFLKPGESPPDGFTRFNPHSDNCPARGRRKPPPEGLIARLKQEIREAREMAK